MEATADITTTRYTNVTVYTHPELDEVARVWCQKGWVVQCAIGPDEFVNSRVATREYAEALALRHALSL